MRPLLICDCDGVLIDSEIIAEHHLHTALAEHYPAHELEVVLAGTFCLQSGDIIARAEAHFGKPLPEGFLEKNRAITKGRLETAIEIMKLYDFYANTPHGVAATI